MVHNGSKILIFGGFNSDGYCKTDIMSICLEDIDPNMYKLRATANFMDAQDRE